MSSNTKKRHPVEYLGHVAGYATTKRGALRIMRKLNSLVTKMALSKGKKPVWQAVEWEG